MKTLEIGDSSNKHKEKKRKLETARAFQIHQEASYYHFLTLKFRIHVISYESLHIN